MPSMMQGKENRGAPVYEKLLDLFLKEIQNARSGDRLPTDRELADRWRVNHQTVRRVMDQLVRFRVVERRVGAGTFLLRCPTGRLRDNIRLAARPRSSIRRENNRHVGFLMIQDAGGVAVELFKQVAREAGERGHQCILRTIASLETGGVEASLQMADEGCYAVILCWEIGSMPSRAVLGNFLEACPLPVVLGDLVEGFEPWCYETAQAYGKPDEKALAMAHSYFKHLGYSSIAFLIPNQKANESLARRLLVYNRLSWQDGCDPMVAVVSPGPAEIDLVVERCSAHRGKLAVICYDDALAVRLILAFHKHQWKLPAEAGVLGFNNISLGKDLDPALSTIQFDYRYVAKAMVEHAWALSKGGAAQSVGGARENLIIRESCGGVLRKGDAVQEVLDRAEADSELFQL